MNQYKFHIACAQLAMVLEVAAYPKPGNVDRDHDFPDTTFEHFLASAVGTYPVLEAAARSRTGAGALIHAAAEESLRWQRGGNTHFGAFVLLIPLLLDCECPYRLCS
jgi:triphosphoribosyl-dephospho-CoA synthase